MNDSANGSNGNHDNGQDPDSFETVVIPEGVDSFSGNNGREGSFDLDIRREDVEAEGASDGSTGTYKKAPTRYEHPLWNLGWTDGRLGQPRETNEELLKAHGRLRWDTKLQSAKRILTFNNARLDDIRQRIERFRSQLEDARAHYEDILKDRRGRYHEFSYLLAAFYLGIALILFLSDVPLTLKLVAKGFDLKTEVIDAQGRIVVGVDDLLVRTWDVILQLWEPLALALGIALAGVFIKLFLDEIIFRAASGRSRRVTGTLSIIMMFLLLTIVGLGIFRARIQNELQTQEQRVKQEQLKSVLKSQGTPDARIDELLRESQTTPESTLAILTFTALTLTLPLIAGACFSAGWRKLKDTQQYRQLKRQIGKLENKLKIETNVLHSAVTELATAEDWLNRATASPQSIDPETEQELNLYRHGYFRGISLPETLYHGLGLYHRTQRTAQKIVARKIRDRIWADLRR